MPDAGLPPLPESEWDDETRAMLSPDLPGGGRVLQHLRDAVAAPEAHEALARVRFTRARQEHPAGTRSGAAHPADGLALSRAV